MINLSRLKLDRVHRRSWIWKLETLCVPQYTHTHTHFSYVYSRRTLFRKIGLWNYKPTRCYSLRKIKHGQLRDRRPISCTFSIRPRPFGRQRRLNFTRLLVAKPPVLRIISLGSGPSLRGCSFLFNERMRKVAETLNFGELCGIVKVKRYHRARLARWKSSYSRSFGKRTLRLHTQIYIVRCRRCNYNCLFDSA